MEILNVDEPRKSLVNVSVGKGVRFLISLTPTAVQLTIIQKLVRLLKSKKAQPLEKLQNIKSYFYLRRGAY